MLTYADQVDRDTNEYYANQERAIADAARLDDDAEEAALHFLANAMSSSFQPGDPEYAIDDSFGDILYDLRAVIAERFNAPAASIERRDAEAQFWRQLEQRCVDVARRVLERTA